MQPCRRPTDGRYGENPNRLQHYYQFQVILKPSPKDIQELYLDSLRSLGIDMSVHDIRFVEDNWESPTLGPGVWAGRSGSTAWKSLSSPTSSRSAGSECHPVSGEITYGIERIAMYLQGVDSIYDIVWTHGPDGDVTYGDVFKQNEVEMSAYNFEQADTALLFRNFDECEAQCQSLLEKQLALPAYEQVLKASHTFNLLDARKAVSVTERQRFILRVRSLARGVAEEYFASRKRLGFPLAPEALRSEYLDAS